MKQTRSISALPRSVCGVGSFMTEGGSVDQVYDATHALLSLTDSVRPDEPRDAVLERIAVRVVALLPGAAAATVSLFEHGEPSTVAATEQEFVVLDAVQYRTGDGPCLHALRSETVVRVDVEQTRQQWPEFADAAVGAGVRTALSCPLFLPADDPIAYQRATGQRVSGALNVWSVKPDAFDPLEATLVAMFTSAMSMVVLTAGRWARAQAQAEQLRSALESRDVIATAKGIVMARLHLNQDDAFRWLTDVSQRTNRKIRDLADLINGDPEVVVSTPAQ
jgi:hypothetical protein